MNDHAETVMGSNSREGHGEYEVIVFVSCVF